MVKFKNFLSVKPDLHPYYMGLVAGRDAIKVLMT